MLYISSAQLIPSPHYPLSPHLPAPQAKWLNVPPTFSQWPHPRSFSPPIWHRSAPILAAERCGAHWPAIILAVSTHPHPPSSPPTRHRPDPALAAGQCAAHRSHPHGTGGDSSGGRGSRCGSPCRNTEVSGRAEVEGMALPAGSRRQEHGGNMEVTVVGRVAEIVGAGPPAGSVRGRGCPYTGIAWVMLGLPFAVFLHVFTRDLPGEELPDLPQQGSVEMQARFERHRRPESKRTSTRERAEAYTPHMCGQRTRARGWATHSFARATPAPVRSLNLVIPV